MRLVDILRDRLALAAAEGTRLLPRHCRACFPGEDSPGNTAYQTYSQPPFLPVKRYSPRRRRCSVVMKFSEAQAEEIRLRRSEGWTIRKLSAQYQCSKATIDRVIYRKGLYR
jgi:hypothetical protein